MEIIIIIYKNKKKKKSKNKNKINNNNKQDNIQIIQEIKKYKKFNNNKLILYHLIDKIQIEKVQIKIKNMIKMYLNIQIVKFKGKLLLINQVK